MCIEDQERHETLALLHEADEAGAVVDFFEGRVLLHLPPRLGTPIVDVGSVSEALFILQGGGV